MLKHLGVGAALAAMIVSAASAENLKSISVLTFGPDNTLFVADSYGAAIHAYDAAAAENPMAQAGFNLRNLDSALADLLGVGAQDVRVQDLAIHPVSKEAYLAVQYVSGDGYVPVIVIANQSGDLRVMDTDTPSSSLTISNTFEDDFKFFDRLDARSLTFTDLDFHKGNLYVSGLSNADFASTLWSAPYPFTGSASTSSVEIYHTTHNQQETRAPIRTMSIQEINGVDTVIAAYTCTPLVTFPLADVQDGAHISGKTIAEMGYGNTPIDLLSYQATDFASGAQFPVMFLTNKNQAAQVVPVASISEAVKGDGFSEIVQMTQKVGVQIVDVPVIATLQAAEQNEYMITTVRRDMEQGDLELMSIIKNAYLRIGDFESEYEFTSYDYPEEQKWMFDMQQQLKYAEGEATQTWGE